MTIEMISRFLAADDLEIRRVNRTAREVTAYAAAFGQEAEIVDRHGHYWERINGTGFNRTLSRGIQRVQVYYNHGYDLSGKPNMLGAVPIASPVSITPDGHGLLTVSRYNDGELADAVLAGWEGGQIKGQSFTGRVFQSKKVGRNGSLDVIERTELGLKEYGPTPNPAYTGAELVAIRSQEDLAELIRSMISEMVGTPQDPSTENGTPVPGPAAPEDSPVGHSGRNRIAARRNYNLMRARELGVLNEAAQADGDRQGS
jgi:HK97 family phage prohead protease